MSRRNPNDALPPFAIEYLLGTPTARPVVRCFHAWLRQSGRPILQLEPPEIRQFLTQYFAARKPRNTGNQQSRRLFRYFDWLHARNLLRLDPKGLWPDFSAGRCLFDLPPQAERFTRSLAPTHKKSSIGAYHSGIRQFHMWLDSRALTIDSVDRCHISEWLQSLHDRKLSAGHRIQLIIAVRAYFQWREEQPQYAGSSTAHLFRRGDLPKRPQYLPRPIPPDLDRVLQRRFGKSRSLPQLGLLLMRRTGLRIGELRALPFHCVQSDHRGNSFLKVPLGKLNNERLVPLDPATLRLIQKLRIKGSTGRRGKRRSFLLESDSGKPLPYLDYRLALERACRGLAFAEPMTSHRLRHTYATSMLAAGVSLPVLMKLLGHRHYQMTLRYAAITIETVTAEYENAVQTIEQRYQISAPNEPSSPSASALSDLARHLMKHVEDNALDSRQARALVRRLERLKTAIQRLLRDSSSTSGR